MDSRLLKHDWKCGARYAENFQILTGEQLQNIISMDKKTRMEVEGMKQIHHVLLEHLDNKRVIIDLNQGLERNKGGVQVGESSALVCDRGRG